MYKDKNGIFVLGAQRSGTTMLGNILASQKDIIGVTHDNHWGIYESSYFSHIEGRYGDVSIRNNYLEFISVMANYDYFRLMGFNFESLKELDAKSYKEFFETTHRLYIEKNSAKYWIEKTPAHSFFLETLIGYFPDAKYIWIKRDLFEALESSYNLHFEKKQNLIRNIIFTTKFLITRYLYDCILKKNYKNILVVDYKKLAQKEIGELKKIEEYLGLKIDFDKNKFKKNSSYSIKKKKINLDKNYNLYMKILKIPLSLIPIKILKEYKKKSIRNTSKVLPPWFFSLIGERLLSI